MRAFTLIELLIVVAIIAILAAIAIPNFLEAQTRSKLSRVRADMRSIALAIEAYSVEHNQIPPVKSTFEGALLERLHHLTTPIAYISAVPRDPFVRRRPPLYYEGSADDPSGATYLYNTGQNTVGYGDADQELLERKGWSLTSGGPDQQLLFPYFPFAPAFLANARHLVYIYDPTNGTNSPGEIFLRGGRLITAIPEIDNR